jgi:voltage-gated potassium channel Kch
MILTPFILSNIYKLSSYFEKEFYESDVITPIGLKNHIVVVGYATLGRRVAADLKTRGADFIIISDNLKHVLLARKIGLMAYFGHLNKLPVLESLAVDEAKTIIITVSNEHNKRLISEAIFNFSKRYGKVHHKNYNLAIFRSDKSILKLIKKYPSIGLITPLSMSIYSDDAKKTINISTLSLAGMARITKIPATNPDLIEYASSVDAALHKALPNGKYIVVNHNTKALDKDLVTEFTMEFELEKGTTYSDAKESFEDEFEGELSPVGFLIPKKYELQEDLLSKNSNDDYDFFDTYSIIRFNAIFPVSKNHPDAGAYAPFSLSIYKKKDEDSMYISFPSIDNWINDLDISDESTIKAVRETQDKIKNILSGMTE